MTSPAESKRRRTEPVIHISLHSEECTESAEDHQRMRDLIKRYPSLLFNTQLNPPPEDDHVSFGFHRELSCENLPLWHACKVRHLSCVELILQATKPGNMKLDALTPPPSYSIKKNYIFLCAITNGRDEDKTYAIVKTFLNHGISPNLEIPLSQIRNPEIVKILRQYKTKTLLFPSQALHMVIQRNSPKILELLLQYGAYPDPVILTESGFILPLYPTLGKLLNPVPAIDHPDIYEPCHLLMRIIQIETDLNFSTRIPNMYPKPTFNNERGKLDMMKILLVHGASTSPYQAKREKGKKIMILETVFSSTLLSSYHELWKKKEFIELLKLYLEFGGTSWARSDLTRVVRRIIPGSGVSTNRIHSTFGFTIHIYSDSEYEKSGLIGREVNDMLRVVPSLQHACRIAIRRAMVYPSVRNIEALSLPSDLIKYMKFQTG